MKFKDLENKNKYFTYPHAFEYFDYTKLISLYNQFNAMSDIEQNAFVRYRIQQVQHHQILQCSTQLASSGSTGNTKKYLWGPHFSCHHKFYDYIFSEGRPYIRFNVYYKPFENSEITSISSRTGQMTLSKQRYRRSGLQCASNQIRAGPVKLGKIPSNAC